MLKPFTIPSDREIVGQILTDDVTISHQHSDAYTRDILDALEELLFKYDAMSEELSEMYEMSGHIEKLEAMLDRRKVRYKKWEDG